MRPHRSSIWLTRFESPKQSVQVCEADDSNVDIGFWRDGIGYIHTISRFDARLLARRINQCLDATRKK